MADALLPLGASSFDLACAGQGWLLAARARTAWGWSPESGWRALPTAPGKIEALAMVADGFLAMVESGKAAGLWVPGEPDWRWWLDPRACWRGRMFESARWRADGSLLALHVGHAPYDVCVLLRIRREGPERLRTFPLSGLGDLRGIEDRGDGPARILCSRAIAGAPLRSGAVVVERWASLVEDEARVVGGLVLNGPAR